jgi:hypothetical protein
MFCGWDWGSTRHGACLIDDNNGLGRFSVRLEQADRTHNKPLSPFRRANPAPNSKRIDRHDPLREHVHDERDIDPRR